MPDLTVAVVGSGPAGCFAAEALARAGGVAVDVLDRLPTPFGLVRSGVAADHQTTKAIARVLERGLGRPGVRFLGNVEVGRDVTLDELRQAYDAVILATGVTQDRRLGIPGDDRAGVLGSARFVLWANSHPDFTEEAPPLAAIGAAVVVGNGNVALDVARVLAKTPEELAAADFDPSVRGALAGTAVRRIHILGRRGPEDAKFTPVELGEFTGLARARPVIAGAARPYLQALEIPDDLPAERREVLRHLKAFAANEAGEAAGETEIDVVFRFWTRPVAIEGEAAVEAVAVTRDRETEPETRIPARLVVSCIGYEVTPGSGCGQAHEGSRLVNAEGRVADGLYVVGWAKRGPSGTIATNRADSQAVAKRLIEEVPPSGRPGPAALDTLLAGRGAEPVSLAGWQAIDAAERAAATDGAPRRKLTRLRDLMAAAAAPAPASTRDRAIG